MQLKEERLRVKGWTEKEIAQTKKLIEKIKRKRAKHPHINLLGEATYWFLVGAVITTIIAIAYWILPLILFLPEKVFYPLIIIIGLSFGMLLWIIIKDLDHLELKHHALISAIIPLTGGFSFTIILGQYSTLASSIGHEYNSILITIIFIFSYAAPYAYHLNDKRKEQ